MKSQLTGVFVSILALAPVATAEIGQSEVTVEMGRMDHGSGLNRARAASEQLVQPFSVVKAEQFGTPREVDGKKVMDLYTDPQVIRNRTNNVTITVDYLDKGKGDIELQYAQADSKEMKT